jgi:hypothetical protein
MTAPAGSRRPALMPLLSWPARVATVMGVIGLVATLCLWAGHASHEAVLSTRAALSDSVLHVTLPTVQVVGRREAPAPAPSATSTSSAALADRLCAQHTL